MGLFSLLQMQGESSWSQNSLAKIKTLQHSQTSFRTLITLIGLMLDRSKGELYLDLGISIHNKGTIPLVGLWQLNKLHDSYALMGTKTGQIHHFGTLGFYGG